MRRLFHVAPLVGAWIEISFDEAKASMIESLPLWERGLKLSHTIALSPTILSLPLWERGLKCRAEQMANGKTEVAPLVGAWIEIYICGWIGKDNEVAPLVGAWIEIL